MPVDVKGPKLTRADFATDQTVRWCPGCGDYAILAQVQKVMPELGIARENIVFVSGIGCSSRFPLLHEHLRLPHHPWPGPTNRHWFQGVAPQALGLGGHGRRRRPEHRRKSPDPP